MRSCVRASPRSARGSRRVATRLIATRRVATRLVACLALAALPGRPAGAQALEWAPSTVASASAPPREPGTVDGPALLQAARRYLGVPYVWGGESARALDCSGFVQRAFADIGVAMPRTAREQAGVGDAPYPGDLQVGDLLFFWGGDGAQHVAIYAGRDSIIHASSRHGRVRMDRLRGTGLRRSWFGRRLIAVRRVRVAAPGGVREAELRTTSNREEWR